MKIISLVLILSSSICATAQNYRRAEFMDASSAEKRWGKAPFNIEAFKSAKTSERAPMAVDAVSKNSLKGTDMKSVRDQLGKPDGYFFSERVLAYLIQPYSKEKNESWQIVFIPDESGDRVGSVKIHKKCCYPEIK